MSDTKLRPVLRATPLGVESCYGVIAVPKKTKASLAEEDETKGGVSLGVCLCL